MTMVTRLAGFVVERSRDDLVRLRQTVGEPGLKPKPEVGIQFGACGTSLGRMLRDQP